MAWKSLIVVAVVLLIGQLALTLASWRAPKLGLDPNASAQGVSQLLSCPGTPNCVCSFEEGGEFAIRPFACRGNPSEDFQRLKSLCQKEFGFRLVEEQGSYARFACVTPLLRYVDDLEFLLDEAASVIHVRSASRVGRSDLGANRARVEAVRRRFE